MIMVDMKKTYSLDRLSFPQKCYENSKLNKFKRTGHNIPVRERHLPQTPISIGFLFEITYLPKIYNTEFTLHHVQLKFNTLMLQILS